MMDSLFILHELKHNQEKRQNSLNTKKMPQMLQELCLYLLLKKNIFTRGADHQVIFTAILLFSGSRLWTVHTFWILAFDFVVFIY